MAPSKCPLKWLIKWLSREKKIMSRSFLNSGTLIVICDSNQVPGSWRWAFPVLFGRGAPLLSNLSTLSDSSSLSSSVITCCMTVRGGACCSCGAEGRLVRRHCSGREARGSTSGVPVTESSPFVTAGESNLSLPPPLSTSDFRTLPQSKSKKGRSCQPSVLLIHDIFMWIGSGSADPSLWLMDPDPVIFVIDLQDVNKKT